MRHRRSLPLAAAIAAALGSLVLILLDEQEELEHYTRRQLSTEVPKLTEDQIQLRESLVCANDNEGESGPTTIFLEGEPEAAFDGCFISSIFGLSADFSDKPFDTSSLHDKYPNYAFLMFTNLVDLEVQGWHKVLHFDSSKKRMTTLSRYPKFLAWKEDFVQKYCPVVYYLDEAFHPSGSVEDFNRENELILQSKEGFVQYVHKPLKEEMDDIVFGNNMKVHMDATLDWMRQQGDFGLWREPRRVRLNSRFGYNPKGPDFQRATQFFWDVYSKEELSWRDQPLWAYTLHHFHLAPKPFSKQLFAEVVKRRGGRKGGRVYDEGAESEVAVFVSSICHRPAQSSAVQDDYCSTEGSLHQIALDMINHSSPPGSPSYLKLKHILEANSQFYNKLYGQYGQILRKNEEMLSRMLIGAGLQKANPRMARVDPGITLVEGIYSDSPCPIEEEKCTDRHRMYIQSEQLASSQLKDFMPKLQLCHQSPNCVILEFSDYNLSQFDDLADSIVLLPVMTQTPSRLEAFEPSSPKRLRDRSVDMSLFGTMTERRKRYLQKKSRRYLSAYPDRVHAINITLNMAHVADFYKESKVCLLAHAYDTEAGGEYHRVSELGPFGCVPVMEHFSDKVGIEKYERCGGAVFETAPNLFEAALRVIEKIDAGEYDGVSERLAAWWKAGIQWEQILPTVYGVQVASIA